MKQPDAFQEFALHCMVVDGDPNDQADWDAIVEAAYLQLSSSHRQQVLSYIDHLLSDGLSDRELWDIWMAGGSTMAFFPSPRWFLQQTREMMMRVA